MGSGSRDAGAPEAEETLGRLDADLAGPERPLEVVPGEGLREQPADVEDQVPAVGAVKGARPEEREVGHQRAEVGPVLDPAHQARVGREVLVHHRSPGEPGPVHQHVDRVAAHGGGLRQRPPDLLAHALLAAGGAVEELVDVLHDVAPDRVQVGDHLGQVRPAAPQLVHQVTRDAEGDLAVHRLDLLAVLPVLRREGADEVAQRLLDGLELDADPLPLLVRKLVEGLGLDHLSVLHRRDGQAERRPDQGDAAGLGLLGELLQRRLPVLLQPLVEGLEPVPVLLALERRRHGRLQFLDERSHVLAKADGGSRRKLEMARPLGLLEVVDVAPVGRDGRPGGLGSQDLRHQAVLADPRRPERIDVVALRAHRGSEGEGLGCAGLLERAVEGFQFGRRLERKARRKATIPQAIRWERDVRHAASSPFQDLHDRGIVQIRPVPVCVGDGERAPGSHVRAVDLVDNPGNPPDGTLVPGGNGHDDTSRAGGPDGLDGRLHGDPRGEPVIDEHGGATGRDERAAVPAKAFHPAPDLGPGTFDVHPLLRLDRPRARLSSARRGARARRRPPRRTRSRCSRQG